MLSLWRNARADLRVDYASTAAARGGVLPSNSYAHKPLGVPLAIGIDLGAVDASAA